MNGDSGLRGRAIRLMDRRGERGVLDQLVDAVRAGRSRVLVVRGEPGVGKSALLDYLAGHAAGCTVARATGVESEMELAFAGLHQLLAPVVDRADRLPEPQRDALRTAFGVSAGPPPDLEGLPEEEARSLLDSVLAGRVDERVRDLIVAETRGNPLALLELPRGLAPAELAGGFGLPAMMSLPGRIEDSFGRQLEGLPEETQRLLALAAADPSGDPLLVWRAAGRLEIPVGAQAPAVRAGLVEFGARVRFRQLSPVSGLPVGASSANSGDSPRAGGGYRPGLGSGPPGLAPGSGRGGPG